LGGHRHLGAVDRGDPLEERAATRQPAGRPADALRTTARGRDAAVGGRHRPGSPGERRVTIGSVEAATRALASNSLVIDRIQTIALRAPLARRFSGSAYSMDNRCTIIVRLTTADGVIAETYSGDTDDEQALITAIIHDELAPAVLGRSARDPE